jgi:predicted patatin/cPLA2 family phospholipase
MGMLRDRDEKSVLIVEGGAMRGVFSAGLLDGFLKRSFNPFDFCIGVSAGASNLAAYLANMPGRSLRIFRDYASRPACISYQRFAAGGHLIDLDWLYENISRDLPLDHGAIYASQKPLLVCLTDVQTGKAVYSETHADNLETVIKASSSLPLLYRQLPHVDGRAMVDGGMADSLPVSEALRRGARRIMVIRSRPRRYRKREQFAHRVLRWRLKRYPALYSTMVGRTKRHSASIDLARQPPPGVRIIEICPPDDFRPGRLCRDPDTLMEGYRQGL